MTTRSGAGAQNCPEVGSVVYFVTNQAPDNAGTLATYVGRMQGCSPDETVYGMPAAQVALGTAEEGPEAAPSVVCAISSLFTRQQVRAAIMEDRGPLIYDHRPLGEIVSDPATNVQLTGILGAVALQRQMDLVFGPEA